MSTINIHSVTDAKTTRNNRLKLILTSCSFIDASPSETSTDALLLL